MEILEKIVVNLSNKKFLSRRDLHSFLMSRGYSTEDDFYYLLRTDESEIWQSDSIMTIDVALAGNAIYETEEDVIERESAWDELKIEYLLATLPVVFIPELVRECAAIATRFNLKMTYCGDELDASQLQAKLEAIADELKEQWDEPGSETLRILIEQSYS